MMTAIFSGKGANMVIEVLYSIEHASCSLTHTRQPVILQRLGRRSAGV